MEAAGTYEYTLNMESIFQDKFSELKSYYCREDFERALEDVKKARPDAYRFRLNDLKRLCKARDLDVDALLGNESLLEKIPTREQMQDQLLQGFHDMYENTPGTADFMERIVRRLAPEYREDSVRVAILKKFLAGAGSGFKRFHTDQILEWGRKRMTREERDSFSHLSPEEQKAQIFSRIDDSIFERNSAALSEVDVFRLIAGRMERYKEDKSLAFEMLELSPETEKRLDEFLKQHGRDCSGLTANDKVLKIVEVLEAGEISGEEALEQISVFCGSLEKDFRNQLKNVPRTSRTGAAGNAAELYKQAKKDALKAKKAEAKKTEPDYELLDMCNDLAAGNFRVNGKTKVYLYYFAFMFGMTVPLEGRVYDPERDIVKNLFQDFYNDNLMRFLEGDYTDPRQASAFEKEPTGEGINYKSFVEVIYLYFLCHNESGMTPGERIDRAEAVIEKCIRLARKGGTARKVSAAEYTQVYRTQYINVLMNKKEEEIPEYIVNNYMVISPENTGAARIMVASEENTAFDLIGEIMEELDLAYPEVELFDVRRKRDLPGELKDEIAFRSEAGFQWRVKPLLEQKFAGDKDFLKVVDAIDERLHVDTGRYSRSQRIRMITLLHILAVYSAETAPLSSYMIQKRLGEKGIISVGTQMGNALSALKETGYDIRRDGDNYFLGERSYEDPSMEDLLQRVSGRYLVVTEEMELILAELLVRRLRFNKRVTRSELISIHFNYYIALLSETEGLDTFPEVFEDYDATISPILEEARYQPLSEKNIFDMYVVTALYFYLVENNGYM